MSKKQLICSIALFLLICASGTLVGLAGGVEWGTADCGVLVAGTLYIALALGFIVGPLVAA